MFIAETNTNELQLLVYALLQSHGVAQESRNGNVLRFPTPIVTALTSPLERVNFCPVRDANPFFHMMEAMAMLASHNDVKWLCRFNSNMDNYSDDGKRWNAFYGERLRKFETDTDTIDQLRTSANILSKDPDSRQVVCQIWMPEYDLDTKSKDKACNTQIMFERNPNTEENRLDMHVINRSNDAIWGSVSGANVVHFSFFQEYVAALLEWEMGVYYTYSKNTHVYTDGPQWQALRDVKEIPYSYRDCGMRIGTLIDGGSMDLFDHGLQQFVHMAVDDNTVPPVFAHKFINQIVVPMYNAWIYRKYLKDKEQCKNWIGMIAADDWRLACTNWVERRESK